MNKLLVRLLIESCYGVALIWYRMEMLNTRSYCTVCKR